MKPLTDLPFILDGATGTQLQKRGLGRGECPETWILEHPHAIVELQRDYMRAGSNAVLAPTFSANRASLARYGVTLGVRDLVRRLVELSREAVDGAALVGGDLAPTGLQFPPAGETVFEEFVQLFAEQAAALEEAGVDFFAVETQMSLFEARAAVLAIRDVSEKPIVVTFAPTERGDLLLGGDLLSALITLQDMGVAAFGVNCCGDLKLLRRLALRLRPYAAIPLVAKPNAGLPQFHGGAAFYDMPPETLGAAVPGFYEAGIRIFGGCCGTGPEHIAELAKRLRGKPGGMPRVRKKHVCASNWRAIALDGDVDVRDFSLNEDAAETAAALLEDGAELLYVHVRDEEELRILDENQLAIRLPLCIECPDGELASRVLRLYNGAPIIV